METECEKASSPGPPLRIEISVTKEGFIVLSSESELVLVSLGTTGESLKKASRILERVFPEPEIVIGAQSSEELARAIVLEEAASISPNARDAAQALSLGKPTSEWECFSEFLSPEAKLRLLWQAHAHLTQRTAERAFQITEISILRQKILISLVELLDSSYSSFARNSLENSHTPYLSKGRQADEQEREEGQVGLAGDARAARPGGP